MSQSPINDFSPAATERYRQGWQALNRLLHENRSFSGNERHCAYLNTGAGKFANISAVSGLDFAEDGRAITPVDWDFDGDLDLWITNRTAPRARLMLNQSKTTNSFLAIMLQGNGKTTNRDAIGARVEVLGLSKPCIQTKHAGESFLSQSSGWTHFGLGMHQGKVDVLVRWPNASPETFSALAVNSRYILKQGSGQAQAWSPPKTSADFAANKSPMALPESPSNARIVLPGGLPLIALTQWQADGNEKELVLESKPTLINVWATWCQPCLTEIAAWAKESKTFAKAGLNILTLNADEDEASRKKSASVLKRLGSPYPAAVGTMATIRRLDLLQRATVDLWEPLPVPSSFLVDSQGYVRIIYKGGVSSSQLVEDLKLLSATPTALRNAAVPFPGTWIHDPSAPEPLRVTSQLVDHNLVNDGLAYLRKATKLDQKYRPKEFSNIALADRLFVAATLLRAQGETKGAIGTYEDALKLNPSDQRIRKDLADLYEKQGQAGKTISELKQLLVANPTDQKLAAKLAMMLVRTNQSKEALRLLEPLVKAQANNVPLRFYHGVAQQRTGNFSGAMTSFEHAHKLDPSHALSTNSLAWIGATHPKVQYRNGKRAVKLAQQLCERTQYRNPSFLMTLAAAQAEVGSFPTAAKTIQKAIQVMQLAKQKRPADIKVLETRLKLYQSGKHFRDASL
ncbi:ASPIC/UnbV domain-containing protein [bacterium]|nr:ASPIC/UnbV domain-containing protein [bacterium]